MRNRVIVSIVVLAVALAFSSVASAQTAAKSTPTWLKCPRCQNNQEIRDSREKYKVDTHPFNAHDLSGIWGNNGVPLNMKAVPPLTDWGKEQYQATKAEESAAGLAVSNSKDGMLICDPLGFPRLFAYNYGFEFVMLPDRVIQFFEWGHTFRTIWTDGRKLPDDPPQARWLGYAIGHWDGDTFVVESNGFDDRSWLSEDRRDRRWGFPHSDQMTTVERYTRTNFGAMDASLTITDPKTFTQPWTTAGKINLAPDTELWEYFCVTSESEEFNTRLTDPASGKTSNPGGR